MKHMFSLLDFLSIGLDNPIFLRRDLCIQYGVAGRKTAEFMDGCSCVHFRKILGPAENRLQQVATSFLCCCRACVVYLLYDM